MSIKRQMHVEGLVHRERSHEKTLLKPRGEKHIFGELEVDIF